MTSRDRVEAIQNAIGDEEVVALYPGPSAKYVADVYGEPYDRHFLLAVPSAGDPWFVTSRKSLDAIRDGSWIEDAVVVPENDPRAVAERFVEELPAGIRRVRIDDLAPYSVTDALLDSDAASVASAAPLIEPLRLRKDEEEIAALERAGKLSDEVSEEIRAVGDDAVGRTEAALANEIRGRLHAKGGTRLSFDVVVAGGPNAARPYYRSGSRRIRAGEPVLLDFGAFVDGYAGDQTRTTVFAGDPPDGFEEAYDAVRDAHDAGVAAAKPGATAEEVHDAATDVIVQRGYEENLIHGTGHGVGLEAHEAPAIGPGVDVELEPGMVFSVEPGIYVEGEFGVRVEDLVVVTKGGCERLNHSPRTWKPL